MFRRVETEETEQAKRERLEQWRGKRKELNDLIKELGQYVGQGGPGEARAPHQYMTKKGTVVQRGRGSFKPKTMYENEMPKPSGDKPILGGVRGAMAGPITGAAPGAAPGAGQRFPQGIRRPSERQGLPETGVADPIMESFIAVNGMDTYNVVRSNIMNADQAQIQEMMTELEGMPEESITRIGLERLILVELRDRLESADIQMPQGSEAMTRRQDAAAATAREIREEESGLRPERERATINEEKPAPEKPAAEAPAEQKPAATPPAEQKPAPMPKPVEELPKKMRERRIVYQTKGEEYSTAAGMPPEEQAKYKSLGEGQIWSDELEGHEPGMIVTECGLGQHKHGDTWGGKCHPAEVNHRDYSSEQMWNEEQKVREYENFVADNPENMASLDMMNATDLRTKIAEMNREKETIDQVESAYGGRTLLYNQMRMRISGAQQKLDTYAHQRDRKYLNTFRDSTVSALTSGEENKIYAAFDEFERLRREGFFFTKPTSDAHLPMALETKEIRKKVLGPNVAIPDQIPQAIAGSSFLKQYRKLLSRMMEEEGQTDSDADRHSSDVIVRFYQTAIDEAQQNNDKDTLLSIYDTVHSAVIGPNPMTTRGFDHNDAQQLETRVNNALAIVAPATPAGMDAETARRITELRQRNNQYKQELETAITNNNRNDALRVITRLQDDWSSLRHLSGMMGASTDKQLEALMDLETEQSDFTMSAILKYQDKFGEKPTENTKVGDNFFTDERMAKMSNRALWKIAQFMGWGGAYRSKPEIIADIKKGVNPAGYEKKLVKVGNFLEHFTKMDEEDVEATWAVAMQAGQTLWVQALEAERDRRYAVRRLQDPGAPPPQWDKDIVSKMTPDKIVNLGGWNYVDVSDWGTVADPGVGIQHQHAFGNAVTHQKGIQEYAIRFAQTGKDMMRLVRTGGREVYLDRNGQNHDMWSKENKAKMREYLQQNHVIVQENTGSKDKPSYVVKVVNKHTGYVVAEASGISYSGDVITKNMSEDEKRAVARGGTWYWGDAWSNPMYRGTGLTSDCFVNSIMKAEREYALKKAKAAGRAGTDADIAEFKRPLNMTSCMITIGSQKFSGPGSIIAGTPEYLEARSSSYVTRWNRHEERQEAHQKVLNEFQREINDIAQTSPSNSTVIDEWRAKINDWQKAYTTYLQESSVWSGLIPGASTHYVDLVGNAMTNVIGMLKKLGTKGWSSLNDTEKKHARLLQGNVDFNQVEEKRRAFVEEFNKRVNERLNSVITLFKSGDTAGAAEAFGKLKETAFGKIEFKEHKQALKYEVLKEVKRVFEGTGLAHHLNNLVGAASGAMPSSSVDVQASEEDIKALVSQETYAEKDDDFWASLENQGEDDLSTIVNVPEDDAYLTSKKSWKDFDAICSSCHRSVPAATLVSHGEPLCPRCAAMLASSNLDQDYPQELKQHIDGSERANGISPPDEKENLDKLHQMFGDIPGAP